MQQWKLRVILVGILFSLRLREVSTKTKHFKGADAIKIINERRAVHDKNNVLTSDYNLQQKALKLVKKASERKGFGNEINAGVNIYQVCATFGVKITAKQVVLAWYNEVCQDNVDFNRGVFDNAESFSQLVWKDTQKVGIASMNGMKGNQTCQYIAAVFRPPGNIEGFYKENVSKGKFTDKWCDDLRK